ncbi:MAG: UDP-N-acetylglucosamine 2-epimerase (non-hydrolyzing), partial [Pseudomonadota bacterium]
VVAGTRPEAIKLSPVVHALRRQISRRTTPVSIIATGQHAEATVDQFRAFGLSVDHELTYLRKTNSLLASVTDTFHLIATKCKAADATMMIVQGDTFSALAGALAGQFAKIPVAHVEAGLRTGNVREPFPEELNRRMITRIADVHFAPTRMAMKNLAAEGVAAERSCLVGNTMVDALDDTLARLDAAADAVDQGCNKKHPKQAVGRYFSTDASVLVTLHRRENWGNAVANVCNGLRELAARHPDLTWHFIGHLNPELRANILERLKGSLIKFSPPQDRLAFIEKLTRASFVITDSGGVQEEAITLGKPVFVLRRLSERPEGLDHNRLLDPESADWWNSIDDVVASQDIGRTAKVTRHNTHAGPFGDGRASQRIAVALSRYQKKRWPLLPPNLAFSAPQIRTRQAEAEPAMQTNP